MPQRSVAHANMAQTAANQQSHPVAFTWTNCLLVPLMPEPSVDKAALRKQTIETLAILVDRYPNLRIGQIIAGALVGDVDDVTDVELARGLNQLFITYTQFEAAGIKP